MGAPILLTLDYEPFVTKPDLELQCRYGSRTFFGTKSISGVGKVRVDGERVSEKIPGRAHVHVNERKHNIDPNNTRIAGLSNREQKKLNATPGFRKAVGKALQYSAGNAGTWKAFIE